MLQSKVGTNKTTEGTGANNNNSNSSNNSKSNNNGNMNMNRSATGKSPRALGVFNHSTSSEISSATSSTAAATTTARGEADGSPAPLADFPYSLDSGATPPSSVTPSLTSPTSTSTTSASPQPPLRGLAEGRRAHKDYSDSLISHRSQMGDPGQQQQLVVGALGPAVGVQLGVRSRADDTDPGESDLDSPN